MIDNISNISTIAKKMNIPHTKETHHHHRSLIVDLWLTMSLQKFCVYNERAQVRARVYEGPDGGIFFWCLYRIPIHIFLTKLLVNLSFLKVFIALIEKLC